MTEHDRWVAIGSMMAIAAGAVLTGWAGWWLAARFSGAEPLPGGQPDTINAMIEGEEALPKFGGEGGVVLREGDGAGVVEGEFGRKAVGVRELGRNGAAGCGGVEFGEREAARAVLRDDRWGDAGRGEIGEFGGERVVGE